LHNLQTQLGCCVLQGVVYKIICQCEQFYIGETGHPLHERITEHVRAFKNPEANANKPPEVHNNNKNLKPQKIQVVATHKITKLNIMTPHTKTLLAEVV
jgi:hypothetical protein